MISITIADGDVFVVLWIGEPSLFVLIMVAGLVGEPLEKFGLEGDELVAEEATLLLVFWTVATSLVTLALM